MFNDSEVLEGFKHGNQRVMHGFYKEHREPFLAFIQKSFSLDPDAASEVYGDSFTALYLNVRNGKLELPLKSSLKTYLFAIGRNHALKKFRKRKEVYVEHLPEKGEGPAVESALEQQETIALVESLLQKMGEGCQKVLRMFYIEEEDFKSIAAALGVDKPASLRKKKFDCLKKMRKLLP